MSLVFFFPFPKQGSILIFSTIAVILMLAVCGSLVLQIRTDVHSTQILKYHEMVINVARGAIYESLNQLNNKPRSSHSTGNIGVTTWNPKTDDVGLDGVPNTHDEGEQDGYPTFALPGTTDPGEPGGHWSSIIVTDYEEEILKCYYIVYDEDLGKNGIDDNHNDLEDTSRIDDLVEASFRRLKAVASYSGQQQKIEALLGNSENFYLFEGFFKAIYVGNDSNTAGYSLDIGGSESTKFDDIQGDMYIQGNIRVRDSSLLWQKERFEDANENGIFDLGESVKDIKGQEIGFYNFGSEATGDVRIRSSIGEDWQTKQPTLGEHPTVFTEHAPLLGSPNFNASLNAVTIKVAEEIKAKGTLYPLNPNTKAVQGFAIQDATHPAHFFVQLKPEQISSLLKDFGETGPVPFLNNGLDTYLLKEVTSGNPSVLSSNGNREVYLIEGNLWIRSESAEDLTFKPTNSSDSVRLTFLVQGNILFENNLIYRDSKEYSYSKKGWNPFGDALAMIALKKESVPNPEQTGNILLADFHSHTLDRIDGYLFAENDFLIQSRFISPTFILNGSMGAGDLLRLNQEYIHSSWRALPDEDRTQFRITFDARIRQFIWDREWLPGLPSGQNRTMPPIPKRFNNILSWIER
ncbi:MAG: hypothetical protein AABZ60_13695 [Planctomycetota bacterium]